MFPRDKRMIKQKGIKSFIRVFEVELDHLNLICESIYGHINALSNSNKLIFAFDIESGDWSEQFPNFSVFFQGLNFQPTCLQI
jgi:hypothetical protein